VAATVVVEGGVEAMVVVEGGLEDTVVVEVGVEATVVGGGGGGVYGKGHVGSRIPPQVL